MIESGGRGEEGAPWHEEWHGGMEECQHPTSPCCWGQAPALGPLSCSHILRAPESCQKQPASAHSLSRIGSSPVTQSCPCPQAPASSWGGARRGKAAVRGRPQACFASFTSHNLHLAFVSSGTQLLSSLQSLHEQGELGAVPLTNTGSQGSAAHGDPCKTPQILGCCSWSREDSG